MRPALRRSRPRLRRRSAALCALVPATRPPADGTPAAGRPPGRTSNGLLIPPRFSFGALLASPRFQLQRTLLQQPGARPAEYAEQVDDVLSLLAGTTGADEVVVTTITHDHADRVRSYQLLADEWSRR